MLGEVGDSYALLGGNRISRFSVSTQSLDRIWLVYRASTFASQGGLVKIASYGIEVPVPQAVKLLPAAIQQNPMHMVLPCQGLADAVRIGKPLRAMDTEGMYPKTGIARHQKPGLATQVHHPVNGPLMPMASNVFPYGPSPLGQPA